MGGHRLVPLVALATMPVSSVRVARLSASLLALAVGTSCTDVVPAPTAVAVTAPRTSLTAGVTVYGPERFTRTKGQPFTDSRSINTAGYQAPFVLHVQNGNPDGSNRVSSGTVTLDGVAVLSPSDFNQQAAAWDIPVVLGTTALLAVQLASAPAGFIEISLSGDPAGVVFCPTGGTGAYTVLQAAINAVNPNGTILVCDGEWDIPEAHVNKPLTIRSQNPGGATLGDTTTTVGGQSARPAIWVDSVPSGTVRFADIGFAVRGRVVAAGGSVGGLSAGTYDRVELDSVTITGRTGTTEFAVMTLPSTVPGAVVEFTNSHCRHVNICVFAAGLDAAVNVRDSRFDSSAVIYTTNATSIDGHGVTENNTFNHCRRSNGCIAVFSRQGNITLRNNRIEQFGPSPIQLFLGAITVTRSWISGQLIIENNLILSHPAAGAPSTPAGWEIPNGVSLSQPAAAPATLRGNRIVDAFTGFLFNGGTINAIDNVVNGGAFGFQQFNSATVASVTFQRNDVAGTIGSFTGPAGGANNYQCNWWGSASGPIAPPPLVPVARYTPFSTVPIANQPSVICP